MAASRSHAPAGTPGGGYGDSGLETEECAYCHVVGSKPGEQGTLRRLRQEGNSVAYAYHEGCALFCPLVVVSEAGHLTKVKAEIKRSRRLRCHHCGKSGAALGCAVDSCDTSYHLHCAAATGCVFDAQRHYQRQGGLFCNVHTDEMGAVDAVGATSCGEWVQAIRRKWPGFAKASERFTADSSGAPAKPKQSATSHSESKASAAPAPASVPTPAPTAPEPAARTDLVPEKQLNKWLHRAWGQCCSLCRRSFDMADFACLTEEGDEDDADADADGDVPTDNAANAADPLLVAASLPVVCSKCGIAVHMSCAGVSAGSARETITSKASWQCYACRAMDSSVKATPVCYLCQQLDAAFTVPLDKRKSIGYGSLQLVRTDRDEWVHLVCALWVAGPYLTVPTFQELQVPPMSVLKPSTTSQSLCARCGQKNGHMIPCCHRDSTARCPIMYHPSCALVARVFVQYSRDAVHLYCADHVPCALYCVCRLPHDRKAFMIECDMCGDWFHGACVQVDEENVGDDEAWLCPTCSVLHQNGKRVADAILNQNKAKEYATCVASPVRKTIPVPLHIALATLQTWWTKARVAATSPTWQEPVITDLVARAAAVEECAPAGMPIAYIKDFREAVDAVTAWRLDASQVNAKCAKTELRRLIKDAGLLKLLPSSRQVKELQAMEAAADWVRTVTARLNEAKFTYTALVADSDTALTLPGTPPDLVEALVKLRKSADAWMGQAEPAIARATINTRKAARTHATPSRPLALQTLNALLKAANNTAVTFECLPDLQALMSVAQAWEARGTQLSDAAGGILASMQRVIATQDQLASWRDVAEALKQHLATTGSLKHADGTWRVELQSLAARLQDQLDALTWATRAHEQLLLGKLTVNDLDALCAQIPALLSHATITSALTGLLTGINDSTSSLAKQLTAAVEALCTEPIPARPLFREETLLSHCDQFADAMSGVLSRYVSASPQVKVPGVSLIQLLVPLMKHTVHTIRSWTTCDISTVQQLHDHLKLQLESHPLQAKWNSTAFFMLLHLEQLVRQRIAALQACLEPALAATLAWSAMVKSALSSRASVEVGQSLLLQYPALPLTDFTTMAQLQAAVALAQQAQLASERSADMELPQLIELVQLCEQSSLSIATEASLKATLRLQLWEASVLDSIATIAPHDVEPLQKLHAQAATLDLSLSKRQPSAHVLVQVVGLLLWRAKCLVMRHASQSASTPALKPAVQMVDDLVAQAQELRVTDIPTQQMLQSLVPLPNVSASMEEALTWLQQAAADAAAVDATWQIVFAELRSDAANDVDAAAQRVAEQWERAAACVVNPRSVDTIQAVKSGVEWVKFASEQLTSNLSASKLAELLNQAPTHTDVANMRVVKDVLRKIKELQAQISSWAARATALLSAKGNDRKPVTVAADLLAEPVSAHGDPEVVAALHRALADAAAWNDQATAWLADTGALQLLVPLVTPMVRGAPTTDTNPALAEATTKLQAAIGKATPLDESSNALQALPAVFVEFQQWLQGAEWCIQTRALFANATQRPLLDDAADLVVLGKAANQIQTPLFLQLSEWVTATSDWDTAAMQLLETRTLSRRYLLQLLDDHVGLPCCPSVQPLLEAALVVAESQTTGRASRKVRPGVNEVLTVLDEGQLLWARQGSFPFWPAIARSVTGRELAVQFLASSRTMSAQLPSPLVAPWADGVDPNLRPVGRHRAFASAVQAATAAAAQQAVVKAAPEEGRAVCAQFRCTKLAAEGQKVCGASCAELSIVQTRFLLLVSQARSQALFISVPDALRERALKLLKDTMVAHGGTVDLAVAIEAELYACAANNMQDSFYSTQIQPIVTHLGDNPDLRRRLILGTLSPFELVRLSATEMASESALAALVEARRKDIQKSSLRALPSIQEVMAIPDDSPTPVAQSTPALAIPPAPKPPAAKAVKREVVHLDGDGDVSMNGADRGTKRLSIDTDASGSRKLARVGSDLSLSSVTPLASPAAIPAFSPASTVHVSQLSDISLPKLPPPPSLLPPPPPPPVVNSFSRSGPEHSFQVAMPGLDSFHVTATPLIADSDWQKWVPSTNLEVEGRIKVSELSAYAIDCQQRSNRLVYALRMTPAMPSEEGAFYDFTSKLSQAGRCGITKVPSGALYHVPPLQELGMDISAITNAGGSRSDYHALLIVKLPQ